MFKCCPYLKDEESQGSERGDSEVTEPVSPSVLGTCSLFPKTCEDALEKASSRPQQAIQNLPQACRRRASSQSVRSVLPRVDVCAKTLLRPPP